MIAVAEDIREHLDKQPWTSPIWVGDIHGIMRTAVVEIGPRQASRLQDEFALHIWEMPQPGNKYTVALDPSSGRKGGDPAALQVVGNFDCQVAEMLMPCREMIEQAVSAIWLANFYNQASLVIEVNGSGTVVAHLAIEMKYPNLWHDACVSPGFTTTMRRRDLMISEMRKSLIGGKQFLRSQRLRGELLAYYGKGPAEDDLTMAMMMAHTCHGEVRL